MNSETNVYKYLRVYFSRCLKFTYHIETFIKENFQKKLNYRTQILGEHGNFNLQFCITCEPEVHQIYQKINTLSVKKFINRIPSKFW
jgi:hypothetical protein